jgi:hypothetical protein
VEGEAIALDNPDPATMIDYSRVVYTLADYARMSVNKRLMDPRPVNRTTALSEGEQKKKTD